MSGPRLDDRLRALEAPMGAAARCLVLGRHSVRLEGLDAALCARLERRWGAFLQGAERPSDCRVRLFAAGREAWLDGWVKGAPYRLEAPGPERLVASHHFALGPDGAPDRWRLGVTETADEPLERVVDNAVRYLAARLAVSSGGFALHAAGLLREGRAYVLAGPSRSGKTTAMGLRGEAISLGDDFALLFPDGVGWVTPALPFDNLEAMDHDPPAGLFPVAGVWRLHPATKTRVERPTEALALASLMACTSFPWAMPDLADTLLRQVAAFARGGSFRHLHFSRNAALWTHLL